MIDQNHTDIFRDFCIFLKENKITFFLLAGSLLGAWRGKKPIDWDNDFDIGIYLEDYEKLKNLILQSSKYYIFNLWRREITVIQRGYRKSESQIDIFAIERDEQFAYMYCYKSNPFSGIWDIEWRMKFPKKYFEELIDCENFISGLTVKIPKSTPEILVLEYGDWETPNPKWSNYDAPAYDKNYREIAILIPTFIRDECLFKLIQSITSILPKEWYRIYIGDQGCYSPEKVKLYDKLEQQGHRYFFLPFNSGLSRTRNFLLSQITEPYILVVDDDFEFIKETKLQNFIEVLLADKDIGVVGGSLKDHPEFNYNLIKQNNKIYYIQFKEQHYFQTIKSDIKETIPYLYCDVVLNFALFKKEIFNDIIWDSELKMIEHSDYYLRLKQLNKWKVAFTPTVIAKHPEKINSPMYIKFRQQINTSLGLTKFEKKWNLKYTDLIYLKEE